MTGHRNVRKARSTGIHTGLNMGHSIDHSIRAGKVGRAICRRRMPTKDTVHHHHPWHATTEVLARSMRGCKAHAFPRNTVAHAMSSTTGVDTVCTSHRVGITGCNTAVITCW